MISFHFFIFSFLSFFFFCDAQVNVTVNGKPVNIQMKIGEAGEAFFVVETDVRRAFFLSFFLSFFSADSNVRSFASFLF